jgi:hypothetical protein
MEESKGFGEDKVISLKKCKNEICGAEIEGKFEMVLVIEEVNDRNPMAEQSTPMANLNRREFVKIGQCKFLDNRELLERLLNIATAHFGDEKGPSPDFSQVNTFTKRMYEMI